MLLAIWVGLVVLTLFGLSGFVLVRNKKSAINQAFALFTTLFAMWILANFIDANFKSSPSALFFTHVDFFLGPWVAYLFWRFANTMLVQARSSEQSDTLFTGLFALIAIGDSLLSLQRSCVTVMISGGTVAIHYGQFFTAYAAAILVLTVTGLGVIMFARHKAKHSLLRTQLSVLLWGIVVVVISVIIPNLIVPLLTKQHTINLIAGNLSYVGVVFFIAVTAYAIVKRRLFDIQSFALRAAVYLTTLALTAFVLVAPIVLLFGYFLDFHPSTVRFVTVVFCGVLALYLMQYLRKIFDKITVQLFFRHYYDPQEVLNELSSVLVGTADVGVLYNDTATILKEAMKPTFLKYILLSDDSDDGVLARKIANQSPSNVPTILDEDMLGEANEHIVALLKSEKIAIAVMLRTTHENIGYLVLGYKRSGDTYTEKDRRLLSVAADEIAIAVQNALRFEEIQKFNATLQQRIDEATRRLRRTNDRLKTLDETKDDFITMASHQLRTPLTSVKGYLSLVLDGDAGYIKPSQRKLLEQAFISSQRMVYLIADLLNVSRLKTGKFIIEPTPTNLADLVQDEVNQLIETAQGRSLELTYRKPAHFPILQLDETKIRQVIMNFIDNAIYYTPKGGHIEVQLVEMPKTIELRVADDGIGVPKAERHQLFTKFYRAQNAQKARPDGTGLGLFMAQKVVLAQGGSTIFHSTEGKGSIFGFSFPKDKLQQPAEVPLSTS